MLKCKRAAGDGGRQGKTDDQRGYWSADERGWCSMMTQTQLSQAGGGAARQGQTHAKHSHSSKKKNGGQWALHCPPPLNSGLAPFRKLPLLSLEPHISLHTSIQQTVPILSSVLSSSPFSGWLGAVWLLTPLTSEGSPWSGEPPCPPAKPSSTEVIRSPCSPGLSTLSWLPQTHTEHTNTQVFPEEGKAPG